MIDDRKIDEQRQGNEKREGVLDDVIEYENV